LHHVGNSPPPPICFPDSWGVYHLAKISENLGWNVNGKVIFSENYPEILDYLLRLIPLFPVGMSRLKITLLFDHFSRFQSSTEEKWQEICAPRSRLPGKGIGKMAGGKCWSHKTVTSLNHSASGQSNRVFQVNGKLPSNPFLSGTLGNAQQRCHPQAFLKTSSFSKPSNSSELPSPALFISPEMEF